MGCWLITQFSEWLETDSNHLWWPARQIQCPNLNLGKGLQGEQAWKAYFSQARASTYYFSQIVQLQNTTPSKPLCKCIWGSEFVLVLNGSLKKTSRFMHIPSFVHCPDRLYLGFMNLQCLSSILCVCRWSVMLNSAITWMWNSMLQLFSSTSNSTFPVGTQEWHLPAMWSLLLAMQIYRMSNKLSIKFRQKTKHTPGLLVNYSLHPFLGHAAQDLKLNLLWKCWKLPELNPWNSWTAWQIKTDVTRSTSAPN